MEPIPASEFLEILGRPADDPDVDEVLRRLGSRPALETSAYYGFLEYKKEGVSVVFQESEVVFQESEDGAGRKGKRYFVAGIHLHRSGHEGYREYAGNLPGDARFGASQESVQTSMGGGGEPGGGGQSSVVSKPLPYWLRFRSGSRQIQFQFAENELEMVTLSWIWPAA